VWRDKRLERNLQARLAKAKLTPSILEEKNDASGFRKKITVKFLLPTGRRLNLPTMSFGNFAAEMTGCELK